MARKKKEEISVTTENKKTAESTNIQPKYLITIDRPLIDAYHQYYLKKHPTARSLPFTKKESVKLYNKDGSPNVTGSGKQRTKKKKVDKKDYTIDNCLYGVLSLNELLVINNRMTMNQLKEQWGELGMWIADRYKLSNLNISNCMMEYRIYSETLAKKDNDNISGGIKFLNDGFVNKSNFGIDDNYYHLNPLLINCDYDKDHPRTEIRISTFDDSIKNVYEKLLIHIENFKDINC